MNKPLEVSDDSTIQIPIRNLVFLLAVFATALFTFMEIQERLNILDNTLIIQQKDINLNNNFRVNWPLGNLGSLPADSEQFIRIEYIEKELEKIKSSIDEIEDNNN
tara:strand:- start:194 stop:511 length:318 start_codon:yes stop_codon:yes gene_type:complete